MKTLFIIDYNRRQLGKLSVDPTGEIQLIVINSDYETSLQNFLEQIQLQPLPLHSHKRVYLADRVRMETHVRYLDPSDPDYLWAVKEYLDRHPIGDLPVVGRMIERPVVQSTRAQVSG